MDVGKCLILEYGLQEFLLVVIELGKEFLDVVFLRLERLELISHIVAKLRFLPFALVGLYRCSLVFAELRIHLRSSIRQFQLVVNVVIRGRHLIEVAIFESIFVEFQALTDFVIVILVLVHQYFYRFVAHV